MNTTTFLQAFECIFGDFQPTEEDYLTFLMEKANNGNTDTTTFLQAFECIFGDFQPTEEDYLMFLVDNANVAFENEAVEVKARFVGTSIDLIRQHEQSVFKTEKSMEVIKKRAEILDNIKNILKEPIKELMKKFN